MKYNKIKICGLKRKKDIEIVNKYKPDYIGFVFAESPRQIDFTKAAELKSLLNKDILAVGVFVDADIQDIVNLTQSNTIDMIQLHGDEDEEYIKKLKEFEKNITIIKAIEVKNIEDSEKWNDSMIDYLLLDNGKGTGKSFNWNLIGNIKKPFFIAGGINVDNMEDIIKFKPFAIDISSGAEKNGVKDSEKIDLIMDKIHNINNSY
ncbi:N-(5'-phosphoribosyl)anthranilate isomerase [Methanobrevibacter cuticularis]|uniref:N-(5'-phosphoribosyl)anthranilate isomerase n=1 Tax=Methanobrevibacter cuticularis TaxID=47311 RepID=A0A166CSD4_9EURY|nr:phosphoribosylanthranilate isomerase [Methanobrevibacter cuticularis]KZX14812.1 N-(5'-phosphoribosyl)anthranilate isomerase [Methanobrevibacter cuticularis]